LQDCEQRKRKEWEETQVNLFRVQQKSLKLQQTQEAGSIFINEVKNIVVTVVAATAVIQGHMTLGMMLAVQYIIGQLNSPVEQLMNFFYSVQDVKISLERINEIHQMDDENGKDGLLTGLDHPEDGIHISNIMSKLCQRQYTVGRWERSGKESTAFFHSNSSLLWSVCLWYFYF
jgi:ATP-binding cassette subfamily B protein